MRLILLIIATIISLTVNAQVKYYLGMDVYSGTRFRDTMRIDSNVYLLNNVGVGTVAPASTFDLRGSLAVVDTVNTGIIYTHGISSNVYGTGIKGFAAYYGESLTGERVILSMGNLTSIGQYDYNFLATRVDTANKFQNSLTLLTEVNEVAMSSSAIDAVQKSSVQAFKDHIILNTFNTVDTATFLIDSNFTFMATNGAITVPNVTTANRPTPTNGMIIYNTTTNQFQFYENGSWVTK